MTMQSRTDALYYTAAELSARGADNIPDAFVSHNRLIYSSPATLAYNSPGAEGFGVKRAGLAIPGSVMLIVSPGCCGRNTSALMRMPEYDKRFFYLEMDETDLITGRYLKKIPEAAQEIMAFLEKYGRKPTVLMICITCVDALLGTDMERVARQTQDVIDIPTRPCYMYALTREGRKPPMVHVRQSLYALLPKQQRVVTTANILGYFTPLTADCELRNFLQQLGIRTINEISRCEDFDAFEAMGAANFNLVLDAEALPAADDLQKRLAMPYIQLTRMYQMDKIKHQYQALAQVFKKSVNLETDRQHARDAIETLKNRYGKLTFSVGEVINANPFELALALLREGFDVAEIFGTVTSDVMPWLAKIAAISPETKVYSNLEPSMLFYKSVSPVDCALGEDACYYHPDIPGAAFNGGDQPFGFSGVVHLCEAIDKAMQADAGGIR